LDKENPRAEIIIEEMPTKKPRTKAGQKDNCKSAKK
jgi:hypothetical protein